ncbi:hypothetical protein [Bradyrhizobium sp.]|uniref:hypothetical protein n=1 Tax=Bradyrhizobium sp. TaxID=376 RepID=UPI0040376533
MQGLVNRPKKRFLQILDRLRHGKSSRVRSKAENLTRDRAKGLELLGLRRDELGAVGPAGPAAVVDIVEIDEGDEIGPWLDDLARRSSSREQNRRRPRGHAIDDHGDLVVHPKADDGATCAVRRLQDARKGPLQKDGAGLQRNRCERRCKTLQFEGDAARLSQAFDAPELIKITRPVDLQRDRIGKLVEQ